MKALLSFDLFSCFFICLMSFSLRGDTSIFLRMKEPESALSLNMRGRGEILNHKGLRQMELISFQ